MRISVKKKQPITPISMMVLFSVTIIFYETVLHLSTLGNIALTIPTILFSLATGTAFSLLLSLISNHIKLRIGTVVLALLGIIFAAEVALYRSLGYFYPIDTVLSMGGAILGSYRTTVINSFLSVLPIALIYQIPTLIFFLITKKGIKKEGTHPHITVASLLILATIVFNTVSVNIIHRSDDLMYLYNSGYDFSEAVKNFGLASALKLEIKNTLSHSSSPLFTNTEKAIPDHSEPPTSSTQYNIDTSLEHFLKNPELPKDVLEINSFVSITTS